MTPLEDRVRRTLQQVAELTVVPPPPSLTVADRPRRVPRRLTAILVAALVVPAAGAVAAAGGYLPGSLENTFSFPDDRGLGGYALQRLGSVPGPEGERFELWSRPGESGGTCFLSALVPDATPADEPARQVLSSSGFCRRADGPKEEFAAVGGGSATTFSYSAGRATRAEVLLTDGTRLPAVVAAGQVAGWLPIDRRDDALLVGYDDSGAVIGTHDFTPWNPPPGPTATVRAIGR